MKQKNLYKRLEQLQKENKIPDDAKVIVVYNGIPAEVQSLSYDLDDYDDPEWTLRCDSGKGDIDIADATDNKTKRWAKSLEDYVSYPITFGKLMKVMGTPRYEDDDVDVWLDEFQQHKSSEPFDDNAEFARITKRTKLQYDSSVNEMCFVIDQEDVY